MARLALEEVLEQFLRQIPEQGSSRARSGEASQLVCRYAVMLTCDHAGMLSRH